MRLLDLYCGAGGAAMGYYRAGFTEIVGVDINPQPRYPFAFVQMDVIEVMEVLLSCGFITDNNGRSWYLRDFDAIHSSPPCQEYSVTKSLKKGVYPKLVEKTRDALIKTGKVYVIENVVGAPLNNPVTLCGSMFGLRVQRHRLFETSTPIWFLPSPCNHWGLATGGRERRNGNTKTPSLDRDGYAFVTVVGNNYLAPEGRMAMDINWMTKRELSQSIPPAYTKFIGAHLIKYLLSDIT